MHERHVREAEGLAGVQDFAEVVAAHGNDEHGAGLFAEQGFELGKKLFGFGGGERAEHDAELHGPQAVVFAGVVHLVADFIHFDVVDDEERRFVFGNDDGHAFGFILYRLHFTRNACKV